MSMKIDRALKVRDQGSAFLHRLFERAETYGYSQQRMLNEWEEWRAKMKQPASPFPHWLTSYWRGIWDTLDNLAAQKREFCYTMNDGRLTSIRKESPIHYEKMDIMPRQLCESQCDSGFYWIKTGNRYF